MKKLIAHFITCSFIIGAFILYCIYASFYYLIYGKTLIFSENIKEDYKMIYQDIINNF